MVMLEEGVIDFHRTDVRGGATTSRSEQGRHLLRGPCARSPEPGPGGRSRGDEAGRGTLGDRRAAGEAGAGLRSVFYAMVQGLGVFLKMRGGSWFFTRAYVLGGPHAESHQHFKHQRDGTHLLPLALNPRFPMPPAGGEPGRVDGACRVPLWPWRCEGAGHRGPQGSRAALAGGRWQVGEE